MINKKNQIQNNLKIKIRTWKEKNQLEELKEEYLHAVIMRKSCETLADLSYYLWEKTSENEGSIKWQRIDKDLRVIASPLHFSDEVKT